MIVQIEDPEPMGDLEQIAQVDGIDMLFFGPGDFSQGIGDPGNYDNPRIAEARRQIAEAARRHGKFAGTMASPDTLAATVAMGYQFINLSADVLVIADMFQRVARTFAELGSLTEGDRK